MFSPAAEARRSSAGSSSRSRVRSSAGSPVRATSSRYGPGSTSGRLSGAPSPSSSSTSCARAIWSSASLTRTDSQSGSSSLSDGPASAVSRRVSSAATTSGAKSGACRATASVSRGSKAFAGAGCLNQSRPSAVGTRAIAAQGRVRTSSTSPVRSTCPSIQSMLSSSQPGSAQGSLVGAVVEGLEVLAQLLHELRGVGSVHEPVIVGEAEVHHRPDRDHVLAALVLDDDRPLDERLDVEDRHLRLADDRRADDRAPAAGVRDGEGAALHVVGPQLLVAGALGDVGDCAGNPEQVQDLGVLDTRDS